MYYYFTSDYPAVLKLNGLYLGSIKDTVKSLSANQPPFIEVCPLQSGYEHRHIQMELFDVGITTKRECVTHVSVTIIRCNTIRVQVTVTSNDTHTHLSVVLVDFL